MDVQGSCFLLLLLVMFLSTKCQLLIPEEDNKCFIEKNTFTLRLRRNEIERDKLRNIVLSLQKDVEIIKKGMNKPINSGCTERHLQQSWDESEIPYSKIAVHIFLLLLNSFSSCCQQLVPEEHLCIRDGDFVNVTLILRKSDNEKEKLKRTVNQLQKDLEIQEEKSNALDNNLKQAVGDFKGQMSNLTAKFESIRNNSQDNKLENAVRDLQREFATFKIMFESTRTKLLEVHIDSKQADYIGGRGGTDFDDINYWKGNHISGIILGCSDKYVNFIQVKYGDNWTVKHGHDDECSRNAAYWRNIRVQQTQYSFTKSEYITSTESWTGTSHAFLTSITIHTNKRVLTRCGVPKGNEKTVNGRRLLYISGAAGCVLDGIQPHWLYL